MKLTPPTIFVLSLLVFVLAYAGADRGVRHLKATTSTSSQFADQPIVAAAGDLAANDADDADVCPLFRDVLAGRPPRRMDTDSAVSAATFVSTISKDSMSSSSLVTLGSEDSLIDMIADADGPVLINFLADWCGPCRVQCRILAEMQQEAIEQGVLMIKVNVDDHPELAEHLQIEGIPTLMVIKDGRIVNRRAGIADRDRLAKWME